MKPDLLERLRDGEALCETIGLKDASLYGEAAREIEELRKLLHDCEAELAGRFVHTQPETADG